MKITHNIKLPKGGQATGKVINVKRMNELENIILTEKYSLGTFKDNHILKPNFIQAHAFALDFDGGYSLDEAKRGFNKFRHIIATTKSHQKKKHGIIDDRFRVILFFSEVINDNNVFKSTVKYIMSLFPKADTSCSNSNRWFYPSKEIIQVNNKGYTIDLCYSIEENDNEPKTDVLMVKKGKLSSKSKELLRNGLEPGNRNNDTYMIAKDFQCNGYDEDEAIKYILKAFDETETLNYDFTEDEVINTIKSAYTSDLTNEPRTPFKLRHYKDIYHKVAKKEWIVQDLLSKGGISLLTGVPKAGKSHIGRQLIRSIVTKKPFFGRKTKFGETHYYGMEEQVEDITEVFKIWQMPVNIPLYIHTGDINANNSLKALKEVLIERKPILIIIDTLFDLLDVQSENSYSEVKKELRKLRQIARDTGSHIMCIHHANKSFGEVRGNFRNVLGSQAIIGGFDTLIMIEMDGETRIITTAGRRIKRWIMRTLIWDDKWQYYTLGPKYEMEEY